MAGVCSSFASWLFEMVTKIMPQNYIERLAMLVESHRIISVLNAQRLDVNCCSSYIHCASDSQGLNVTLRNPNFSLGNKLLIKLIGLLNRPSTFGRLKPPTVSNTPTASTQRVDSGTAWKHQGCLIWGQARSMFAGKPFAPGL